MDSSFIQINVFSRLKSRVAASVHGQTRSQGSLERTWERGWFTVGSPLQKLDFWDFCQRRGETIGQQLTDVSPVTIPETIAGRGEQAISEFPGPLYQNEVKCSTFDIEMIFHIYANKTHFHKKGFRTQRHFESGGFGNSEVAYFSPRIILCLRLSAGLVVAWLTSGTQKMQKTETDRAVAMPWNRIQPLLKWCSAMRNTTFSNSITADRLVKLSALFT